MQLHSGFQVWFLTSWRIKLLGKLFHNLKSEQTFHKTQDRSRISPEPYLLQELVFVRPNIYDVRCKQCNVPGRSIWIWIKKNALVFKVNIKSQHSEDCWSVSETWKVQSQRARLSGKQSNTIINECKLQHSFLLSLDPLAHDLCLLLPVLVPLPAPVTHLSVTSALTKMSV